MADFLDMKSNSSLRNVATGQTKSSLLWHIFAMDAATAQIPGRPADREVPRVVEVILKRFESPDEVTRWHDHRPRHVRA
jgi:hypothetical protein